MSEAKGYAVIVNFQDSEKIYEAFDGLKFDVNLPKSKTKNEMMEILTTHGNKDYTEYNMFACVISSHDTHQAICGSDGNIVEVLDVFKKISNIGSLKGKPKLFVIDVCRLLPKRYKKTTMKNCTNWIPCSSGTEDDSMEHEGSTFCKVLCDVLNKYDGTMNLNHIHEQLKLAMHDDPEDLKLEIINDLPEMLLVITQEEYTRNDICTVAIEVGTYMSGFAYSTRDEFFNSPLSIFHKQCWNSESKNHDTMKTASSLLLSRDKQLIAFGFDAQAEFAKFKMMDRPQDKVYYFHNLNMIEHNEKKKLADLQLKDIQGELLPAKHVFASSIQAIKIEVLKTLASKYHTVAENRIKWVLTVPGIWPDDAKQFMRNCAQETDIPLEQLLIVFESEAAFVYSQFLTINKEKRLPKVFPVAKPGTGYMIVDVGGGRTDIAIHMKEIKTTSEKNIGSSYINEEIIKMFNVIFGTTLMNNLKTESPSSYLDLCWEIEVVKKTVMSTTSEKVGIALSYPVFDRLCRNENNKTLDEVIAHHNSSANEIKVKLKDDTLLFNKKDIEIHFKVLVKSIIEKAKHATKFIDVSLIILVGGFADCRYLKVEFERNFKTKKVITPEDANLAVLKGAVLYGQTYRC